LTEESEVDFPYVIFHFSFAIAGKNRIARAHRLESGLVRPVQGDRCPSLVRVKL
jgi:hypothetical protein